MESFGAILLWAIPGFVLLILIENLWGWYKGVVYYRHMDTISSLSSGMTNIVKQVLGLTIVILSYSWLEARIALWHFDVQSPADVPWWAWVAGFIALDLAGYIGHRLAHEINVLWNTHIVHHSSEEFNLACALRQEISHFTNWGIVFLLPAALLGVPDVVIAILAPFHLFAQFWYHTRYIGKMGWLEHVLVTPSHHRVHHAINPEYLDKNYAQIFIVWDKWFGTFQEELPDVPPVYGVKRAVHTWNPLLINFQHMWLMLQDTWRAKSWWDKARLWFKPTGWRPADVAEKYPVEIIENPYTQVKYDTPASPLLLGLSYGQLLINNLLLLYLFGRIAFVEENWGFPGLIGYGLFVVFAIFSYTTLMDRKAWAAWIELVKSGAGLGLIYALGGTWFGINEVIPYGTELVAAWMLLSAGLSAWVAITELRPEQQKAMA
jgi:alkylglycerol monooxygenase